MINIIAAVGKNLEIGKDNNLIWHIPNDLKYFKKITTGKKIVMGRRTYESIGSSLPNRDNIVLTNKNINIPGCIVINKIDEIIKDDSEIFIIGGASLYKLFLPYADNLYLTEIEDTCNEADTFFLAFDKSFYFKEVIKKESYNDLNYSYVRYRKK